MAKSKSMKEKKPGKAETKSDIENKPVNISKKPIKLLVILVIILIIVDFLSLIFYIKPDFSSWKFNFVGSTQEKNASEYLQEGKCEDGTPFNACSDTLPLFCYNGELLDKAFSCGCPSGYVVEFQGCRRV